ncbi:MAG: hypothetical protein JXC85_04225 [Candidatus Aenigmarchaeota archaeon]|nr:hypothetical protein [Candidatus Aenigmarchaeota archaeon]
MDQATIPAHEIKGTARCSYGGCVKILPIGSEAFLADDAAESLYCSDIHAMLNTEPGEYMSGHFVKLVSRHR